jgi:HD-like signal output (HDOD) protein
MAYFSGSRPVELEWLISKTVSIYSMPVIYERLDKAINNPRSSISDIVKILTEDQGLTARILKLANSPMFGCFSQVDSVAKAVAIIGTRQLRDLALPVMVMEIFKGIPEEMIDMRSFWRHSIACGVFARTIAAYCRKPNIDTVFTAGVLHDIGRLVMCTNIPDIMNEMLVFAREEEEMLYRIERSRLGFTHAVVGGGLLSKWQIPASIVEPVACHHVPSKAKKFHLEVAIVHLADIMCKVFELGTSGDRFIPPLDLVAWELLDIPAGALAEIVEHAEPQLEEMFAILGD